jgi:hypothetical protein
MELASKNDAGMESLKINLWMLIFHSRFHKVVNKK